MSQIKYPVIMITVAAVVFVMYGFVVGLYTLLNIPDNPCQMTYMFQMPQYIPVPVLNSPSAKYSLFVYGEGAYAESLKEGNFDGIPVLFLPGNAGCYKQVRSLASMSYRMFYDLHKAHHFNYFTIDFNEELSGLYGGVLYSQSDYVVAAIQTIISLYPNPTKVILIGHSMGGLVARSVFLHPLFPASSVDLILTLSTPHNTPPFNFEWNVHTFYREWEDHADKAPQIFDEKVFISIGSGIRDTMVQPYQTILHGGTSNNTIINVLSTCIPQVWVSPDHLQMVWCKQLVKKICLTLFDMIDRSTLKISEDISKVRDIAAVNFLGSKPAVPDDTPMRKMENPTLVKDMKFSTSVVMRDGWQQFKVPTKPGFLTSLVIRNPPHDRWLYHCTKDATHCEDLSFVATQFPDNYLVYSTDKSDGVFIVHLNAAYGREKKGVKSDFLMQHHPYGEVEMSYHENSTLQVTDRLFLPIIVNSFSPADYWISLSFGIRRGSCSPLSSSLRLPLGRMKYNTEDTYEMVSSGSSSIDIPVQILTVQQGMVISQPKVEVILDPACVYTVTVSSDGFRTAANLIRYQYDKLGGCLLFAVLSLCVHVIQGEVPSLIHSFTTDRGTTVAFVTIVFVKLVLWIFPSLHGLLGIDWMTVHPEILLTSLLITQSALFSVFFVANFLGNVLRKVTKKLQASDKPWYTKVRYQLLLCVVGMATSGSLVSTLNLVFMVFHILSSSSSSSTEFSAVMILHAHGSVVQLPTLLAWLKNLMAGHYWLESDVVSRVAMAISSAALTIMTSSVGDPHKGVLLWCVRVIQFIVLTVAVTRGYLLLPLSYLSIGLVVAVRSSFLGVIKFKCKNT